MATLIKVLRQDNDPPNKKVLVDFNGPASYPNTGSTIGDVIKAVELGLSSIEHVSVVGDAVNSSGVAARSIRAALPLATPTAVQAGGPTQHTQMRITWHDLDGTQIANTTDLSTFRARMVVWGNGS